MTYYTLFNKNLKRKLMHPIIGLWFTNDINEARDMLALCKKYFLESQTVKTCRLEAFANEFVVVDAETGEEVSA